MIEEGAQRGEVKVGSCTQLSPEHGVWLTQASFGNIEDIWGHFG